MDKMDKDEYIYMNVDCICGEGTQNHVIFRTAAELRASLLKLNQDFSPPPMEDNTVYYTCNDQDMSDEIRDEIIIKTECLAGMPNMPQCSDIQELLTELSPINIEGGVYRVYVNRPQIITVGEPFYPGKSTCGVRYIIEEGSRDSCPLRFTKFVSSDNGVYSYSDIVPGEIVCEEGFQYGGEDEEDEGDEGDVEDEEDEEDES